MVSLPKNHDWSLLEDLTHSRLRSGKVPAIVPENHTNGTALPGISYLAASKVECHWAKEKRVQFMVSVASDIHVEQLRLPDVDRVTICQEFDAAIDDQLELSCVAAFRSASHDDDCNSQIEIQLTNLNTHETTTLLTSLVDQGADARHTSTRLVENIRHKFARSGRYELRISQQLNGSGHRAKSQLWIHDAELSITDHERVQPLLSISSQGISGADNNTP